MTVDFLKVCLDDNVGKVRGFFKGGKLGIVGTFECLNCVLLVNKTVSSTFSLAIQHYQLLNEMFSIVRIAKERILIMVFYVTFVRARAG